MQQVPLSVIEMIVLYPIYSFREKRSLALHFSALPQHKAFPCGQCLNSEVLLCDIQFSDFDMKGRKVPILVREQGEGRGIKYNNKSWAVTYSPIPHYITSKLRSLFLENTEYSVFNLTLDDLVEVEVASLSVRGRIIHGNSPLDIIRSFTEYSGKCSYQINGRYITM